MTERKLASVRKIAGLQPIAGADKIELAIIDGWQVVVKKGEFKVDDLCVYFEIDSFLPCIPVFEFLRKGCFKSTKHLGDGYRLRTIKLKKTLSQGLALPLADLFVSPDDKGELAAEMRKNVFDTYQLGADLTEILGVKKYEIEIPASLAGTIKGNFPSWLKRTDQERIQNCFNDVPKDHCYEVTLKLDGSSLTVYKKDGAVSVCSRNLELVREPDNAYWKVVIESGLEQRLLEIPIDRITCRKNRCSYRTCC
jgi:RNA ligase (TIGR02306 family)